MTIRPDHRGVIVAWRAGTLQRVLLLALALAAIATPARSQTAPPGSIIDLGTGTAPTVGPYTQYSATVTAQTTGLYYTLFAFREVPAFFRFDDATVTAVGSSTNLLVNPGFEGGSVPSTVASGVQIPVGWGTVYQTGTPPGAAGTVTNAQGAHTGSYVWYDGSIESFDGIYQTITATAGQQYLISFFLEADNPFSTPTIEMATYFGSCGSAPGSCTTSFGNGFEVGQPAAPTINTTDGDLAPNRFSLSSPAAQASSLFFAGGTLVEQGGNFAGNIITAPVTLSASNGTVDTTPASGGFSGVVSGPGSLTVAGSHTFSLTGNNTYTGGTFLQSGTLAVGSDTALGTGLLSMVDGTTLQFIGDGIHLANPIALSGFLDPVIDTGSGTQTVSGPITGPGALTKIGSGTLDLTGSNTYTGATEVAAGTLLVDGSIVNSTVTVDSGAFLGGSGSIKSAVLNSGATLNLVAQTLSVTSNVSFLTGSTYQVIVNADGTGSKLAIGGTASLGGARLSVLAGSGTFGAKTYTLLTAAGGVSGAFGTVDVATSLALLRPQVSYGATDVVLTLNPVDFRTIAATPNQTAVAGAIQALGQNSPLYNAVLPLDRAQAQQAFASASGVSHAAPTAIVASLNRLSTGLLIDRLWDVTGSGLSAQQVLDQFAPDRMPALVRCYGPVADPVPAPKPPSYTAWGEAFGTFGHTDGGANSGALDRTLGGFVLGLDTPFEGILQDKWRGGVAVGYTNTSYTSHLDGGTGTLQGVFGSLYAGARYGAVDVRVGTTVGGTFTDARRTVAFPGFMESEKSSNDGYSVQTFGEVGYRIPAQGFVFEPVAGLSFLHSHEDGFREKGGAAALTVGAVDNDLGTTSVGFRTEMQPFKDLPIVAHAFLAWQHVIGNLSPATTLAFEAAPAGTFSITGIPIDRDALAAELAMDYRVSTALDIGLSYSGQVGPTAYDHSVKGRFEYRF